MKMNSKVFAAMFVACLMIASFGAIVAEQSSEASGTHYTDIDQALLFNKDRGQWSAKVINDEVGSEVCNYDPETSTLTFTASCNLRGTSDSDFFFLFLQGEDNKFAIIVNEGVTVNLMGGTNYKPYDRDEVYSTICTDSNLLIGGDGKLNVAISSENTNYGAAVLFITGMTTAKDLSLYLTIKECELKAPDHSCVVFFTFSSTINGTVKVLESHVLMEGKYAIGAYPSETCTVSVDIGSKSWVKLIGTEKVFFGKSASIDHPSVKLYASESYRATNIGDLSESKLFDYQYISTENNSVSGLVIPLIVIFVIICAALFFFVFIYIQRTPWEQEKYDAEKAKKKAELAAKKAEEKKLADAKKAEMEKKKAAEAKKKEEARLEAEKKKAAEAKQKQDAKKAADAKKAKDKADAEKKKLAEAKEKEEAKKAAEKKKAADKKAAEEKKAAEAKKKEEAKKAKEKADAKKAAKKKK